MLDTINTMIVQSSEIRKGRPRIAGTGVTVHRIATWYNLGHTPEEIAAQYPHLTLAKVFAALAWYFEHQEMIDAEMLEDQQEAERLEQQSAPILQPA